MSQIRRFPGKSSPVVRRPFSTVGVLIALCLGLGAKGAADEAQRTYSNQLTVLENPTPLLANYPNFVAPIIEQHRFEAPPIVVEKSGRLLVRGWRFSYNARGIIEAPNRLDGRATAIVMVHPWGIDDGQGWRTPQPAGVADFCTIEKNKLAGRHTREVINPLLRRLRPHVKHVLYSLPGGADPLRTKCYRTIDHHPSAAERLKAQQALETKLKAFAYQGQPLPQTLTLSGDTPLSDYFKQFPGLDAGDRYNQAGFWDLPIPLSRDVDSRPNDVVVFDAEGYPKLRDFLKREGVRHILLTGYATDMCFCRTTAGYENLSKDFNVFLVGDATLATFPANASPQHATNAAISFASLNQMITQCDWIRWDDSKR